MAQFDGLTEPMFALYTPAKWSSNVHNLARMRNKDVMVALGELVQTQAADLFAGLVRAYSDEVPNITNHKRVEAQWLYWCRDQAEKKSLASFLERMPLGDAAIFTLAAHQKHATLAAVLQHDGLWYGLHIGQDALVDRRNLLAKLQQSWERQRLLTLCAELPQQAVLRLDGQEHVLAQLDEKGWAAIAQQATASKGDLSFGVLLSIAEATAQKERLAAHLAEQLALFAGLYRFAAWSRSNDLIEAGKQLQAEKAQKRRGQISYSKDDPVRVLGGMFSGKRGVVVEHNDARGQVKVQIGSMAVLLTCDEVAPAPR